MRSRVGANESSRSSKLAYNDCRTNRAPAAKVAEVSPDCLRRGFRSQNPERDVDGEEAEDVEEQDDAFE